MSQEDREFDERVAKMVTDARSVAHDHQKAAVALSDLVEQIKTLNYASVIGPDGEKDIPKLLRGDRIDLGDLGQFAVTLHARASIWATYADQAAAQYGYKG